MLRIPAARATTFAPFVILVCLTAQAARAEDAFEGIAPPPEPAHVDSTTAAKPEAPAAEKNVPSPGDADYEPPAGFKVKKQGKFVLYCMRDRTTGTRFTTEKCYNGDQLREYLLALEVQKRDIDRIRSTCASGAVCAPP